MVKWTTTGSSISTAAFTKCGVIQRGTSSAPLRSRFGRFTLAFRAESSSWRGVIASTSGLRTMPGSLAIDGGVYLLPTVSTAIATEAGGSWHLTDNGLWVFFGLPRLDEPPIDGVVISDAGLAEYQYYKPLGARCERGDECWRSQCVNGRCCSRSCPSCAVCSIEAGGQVDGECSPAPAGTFCFDAGCGAQTCDGVSWSCNVPPNFCGFDAGVEPEFDAGPPRPRRDAGIPQQPSEPEPEPSGCGCGASPVGFGLALVLFARRRRLVRC